MRNFLSLSWRVLLAASLVLNPVAGAWAAAHAGPAEAADIQAEELPPCHATMAAHDDSAPAPAPAGEKHGCDCGDPVCHSGACCMLVALQVPDLGVPAFTGDSPRRAARDLQAAEAPPPARMIRPPIA